MDSRETSPISSLGRFVLSLHKYETSLAPPLLTFPVLAFSAYEPLSRTESTGEKKGEERERERERLTAVARILHHAMAGGPSVILPADPWDPFDVSMEMLQSLVDDGLLRPITDPDRPEWIAPSGKPEPRPREGYVVSFVSFHERGLGLSADRFMRALPHYYSVEPHNFNPNSIA